MTITRSPGPTSMGQASMPRSLTTNRSSAGSRSTSGAASDQRWDGRRRRTTGTGGGVGGLGTTGTPIHPSCIVPRLNGKALGDARTALARSHCAVGQVNRPRKPRKAGGRGPSGTSPPKRTAPGRDPASGGYFGESDIGLQDACGGPVWHEQVNRYTFVVHAYPGGASMLENLSTHERIRVCDLAAVGPQIESWLASLAEHRDAEDDRGAWDAPDLAQSRSSLQ